MPAWLFVLLGIVGLSAALYDAVATPRRLAFSLAAIALLAAAWWLGHPSAAGWFVLAAAFVVEFAGRLVARSGAPRPPTTVPPKAAAPALEPPASAGPAHVRQAEPAPFRTNLLLKSAVNLSPQVVVACLRRAGERRATIRDDARGGGAITVGNLELTVASLPTPIAAASITTAAAQSWEWPEAASQAAAHAAHVRVETAWAKSSDVASHPPIGAVRLHVLVHRALAEFAPIVAAHWEAAQRLVDSNAIVDCLNETDDFKLAQATCLVFRSFPCNRPEEGFLSDVSGLSALGLLDAEISTPAAPDESVSRLLYDLARESFARCVPIDQLAGRREDLGRAWRMRRGPATFRPARDVLRFEPQAAPDPA